MLNQGDGRLNVRTSSSFGLDHIVELYRQPRKDDVLILTNPELLNQAKQAAMYYSSFAEMDIDDLPEIDWFSPTGYQLFSLSQEEVTRITPLFVAYCNVLTAEKWAAGKNDGITDPPIRLEDAQAQLETAKQDVQDNAVVYRATSISFADWQSRNYPEDC